MTPVVVLAVAAWLLAAPVPVAAHSLLLESSPPARAVLTSAPARVELQFNNRIEKRLSGVQLIGPRGERVTATVLDDGPPDRLRASLPALPPGNYRVQWRVLSMDGHVVTGSFPFTIAP